MDVNITNTQSDLPICENSISQIARAVVDLERQVYDEVGLYFVSEEEICSLHERFFGDPSPTDCISFPMDTELDEGYRILGEVFVCPQTAIKYAKEHHGNPYQELTLYIIHGLLHLMGYHDIKEEDRRQMRLAEEKNMLHLKEKGLL